MSDSLEDNYALDTLWSALPRGQFTGATNKIDHQQVVFIAKLVRDSGVAEKIDAWQQEDRESDAPGGRGRTISTHTILTLLLLISAEHTAQLVNEMASVLYQRLRFESLNHLDVAGRKGYSNGEPRTQQQWYFVCWRALHRALEVIDPRPMASTERGKFPTDAEVEQMKQSWETEALYKKHDRLKLVCADLLEATWQLVPKEIRDNWKGDTSIDASVVPVYAKRGAPYNTNRGSIEPTAGWYKRDANHKATTNESKVKKAIYGWDGTVIVQVPHNPTQPGGFPSLIMGMGLTVPGMNLIATAAELYTDMAGRRGHPTGRATGDRGYSAAAKPEEYQMLLRRLGYKLVGDYTVNQLGEDSGAEFEGAIQVEGAWYCPSMPLGLINATKEYRAGTIDHHTWRKRIGERRQYMFRPKQKPDPQGRVPWMCPARGPGATVLCPLVETCSPNPDELTPIHNPPAPERQGKACTNKSSVTIPITAGAKHAQEYQYGSAEWQTFYTHDRNAIEATNGFIKDSAKEAVGDAGRRRLRGIAAQQLSICMLFVVSNLRKIQAFRDERVNFTPAEQIERAKRKLAIRANRKARKDRQAPWENFTQKPGFIADNDPPDVRRP